MKYQMDGATPRILDEVEVRDIRALQVVNENSTQFGEDLVAERTPILELNSSYGFTALRYVKEEIGSGTVTNGTGTINLSTGTTAGSEAELQSAEIGRYQPGMGAQLGINFVPENTPEGDEEYRWGGKGEVEDNALRFGWDATGVFVEVFKDGVTREKTYQADWNLDKLNGSGLSGVTLDPLKGAIYQIEFTWYGSGEVLFGVVRQTINSLGRRKQRFIPCHQYLPDDGEVSISTPNLRPYGRALNGTGTRDIGAKIGGMQYSIVGRFRPKPRLSSDFRGSISTSTTVRPLVSAKRKTGFGDRSIKLALIEAIAGNQNHVLQVRVGGTLTGENFRTATDHTGAETALQYDVQATAITGGIVIEQKLLGSSAGAVKAVAQSILDIDVPNGDIISLCARTITGTSTIDASLLELREEW